MKNLEHYPGYDRHQLLSSSQWNLDLQFSQRHLSCEGGGGGEGKGGFLKELIPKLKKTRPARRLKPVSPEIFNQCSEVMI